jgi:hypothetical protein
VTVSAAGKVRFNDRLVHERMIVDGRTGRLSNSIMHTSYKDLEQVLTKLTGIRHTALN